MFIGHCHGSTIILPLAVTYLCGVDKGDFTPSLTELYPEEKSGQAVIVFHYMDSTMEKTKVNKNLFEGY